MSTANVNNLTQLDVALQERLEACRNIIRTLGRVCVAFSGGVDSSLLLALAAETLGHKNVLAAMAVGTIFPQWERQAGKKFAQHLGVELVEIETPQLTDPRFTANPTDRCYYCKTRILGRLKALAAERNIAAVATGSNASDTSDFRPGLRAEEQMGVRRPLLEAGLTKDNIREISRAMNLEGWNRASSACLASRIPYGQPITEQKLRRVEQAELFLRGLGFEHCRVRDHTPIARIEVPAEAIARAIELRGEIVKALNRLGYTYIALDLEGFRSGSMNETLPPSAD